MLKEVGIGESRVWGVRDQWGTVGRVPPIPVKPNTKKRKREKKRKVTINK